MDRQKYSSGSIGQVLCSSCGIPADSEYFDESGVDDAPKAGRSLVLATFVLPPQYCGVLQYFAQYTDLFAGNVAEIETPGLVWTIVSNGRPLYPYVQLSRILNPWGYGSFPIAVRLDDNATVEFVVRGVGPSPVQKVGGRLVGRYWYNVAYGDVAR
jgi:hypothetical protein